MQSILLKLVCTAFVLKIALYSLRYAASFASLEDDHHLLSLRYCWCEVWEYRQIWGISDAGLLNAMNARGYSSSLPASLRH
jgi:hypothetical protein